MLLFPLLLVEIYYFIKELIFVGMFRQWNCMVTIYLMTPGTGSYN